MNRRIHFMMPDPAEFVSGGNVYNSKVLQAFDEMNWPISRSSDVNLKAESDDLIVYDSIFLEQLGRAWKDRQNSGWNGMGKKIMLVHHLESMYPRGERHFNRIERPVLQQMDGFWVTSSFSSDYLEERMPQIPSWIWEPIFEINEEKVCNWTKDKIRPSFLIVANLIPRKGIVELIEVIGARSDLPRIDWYVSGEEHLDPNYREACFQLVEQFNLQDQMHFLGPIRRSELLGLMCWVDALISVSHFETFGMAIQEAKAYGVPVLAVDGGNVKNILEEGDSLYNDIGSLVSDIPNELSYLTSTKARQPRVSKYAWSELVPAFQNFVQLL